MKYTKILFIFLILGSLSSSAQIPTSSGFYFDGVDDRVTIPSIPAYNNLFDNDFSIEFWCKPDSTIYEYNVITIGDGISSIRLEIKLQPNKVIGTFWHATSGSNFENNMTSSIYDDKCHHFVFVAKNKVGRWYTDGANYSNYSNTYNFPVLQNPIIIVGQDYINPQFNSFKGLISGVRLWKKALSQAEILNSIVAPATPTLGVLLADWKLDNKYKQKVQDYSMYGNFGYKGFGSTSESSDPGYSAGCLSCIGNSISIQKLNNTSFCAGDSSKLKVIIPANYSCQWYKDGKVIAGQTDSIIYGKTNGVFSAILTDTVGCKIYSDAVVLRIYFSDLGNPIRLGAKSYSSSSATCWWPGRKDTLQVGYNYLYSYQWLNYGLPILNATSYKLVTSDTGEYACQVSVGSCTKVTYKYYINALRATIEPLSSPVMCLDTIVELEVDLPWSSSPQYVWKSNGVVIPNGNSSNLNTSVTGFITCTVTDTNYCPLPAISPSIYVAHNQDPGLIISAYSFPLVSGGSFNDCSGLNGMGLELVDKYGFSFNSPDLLSVGWYGDYPFFQTSQNSIAIDSKAGYYGVSYTTVCGSGNDSKSIYFAGPYAVRPSINGVNSHCSLIQLGVDAPIGFTWPGYQWYFNDSIIPGATNSSYNATKAGDYFCVLNNSCDTIATYSRYANILFDNYKIFPVNGTAICNGVPKQLQIGGGNSFQWKKNGVVISGATSGLYTATTPGTYVCLISGNCGSTSDTVVITNGTALVPPVGCISGVDIICPTSSYHQYSVQPVAGANHYSWILPYGATANSKLDSNSISIQFGYYFYGGTLYFLGINDCGTDTLCSIYIHSLKPKAPVLLSGDVFGLCGGIKIYRCSIDTLVSNYVWTVPTGATILSGQGTDSLVVQIGTLPSSAYLKVYGASTCVNSPELSVGLSKFPNNSGPISGSANVCANQTSLTYSVLPVAGAVSYLWTLPSGAIQTSGGNSDSITITMGASSGLINLRPQSSCQTGNQTSKLLNVVCREGFSDFDSENSFIVYPNPAHSKEEIYFSSVFFQGQKGEISLLSTDGRILMYENFEMLWYEQSIHLPVLASGMYICELKVGGESVQQKLLIVE